MKYCLDASALIDLGERHYPEYIKVFTPIWDYIYNGIEDGDIVSVDYVKIELERQAGNWREQFLLKADKMFQMYEAIEAEYANVITDIELGSEFRNNKHRERFMSGADPWLIALARNIGECTVVSAENKSITNYGLGPVCKALGVSHINLVQFFEANNIGI